MLCLAKILSSLATAKKRKTLVKFIMSDRLITFIPAKKEGMTDKYSNNEEVERI